MKKAGFKMFVKKFTAYVLVAVMTLSTPLTAFAADFSDNFSQSDGTDGSNSKSETVTETVSSTQSDTNTNTTVLGEDAEKITGFMIYGYNQNDTITMTPGNKKTLTAAILVSGSLKDVTMADLNKNIKWTSSAPSIVSVNTIPESMNKCELKAENAGNATITASYNDYMVVINVKVIDPSKNKISWNVTDTFYVKHTYCLSDYLWFNDGSGNVQLGDATTDVVTFAVKASPKVATISGDMLTIKGVGTVKLSAVLPNGTEIPNEEITTNAGSPVKKMTASNSKVVLDFNEKGQAISDPSEKVSLDIITTDGADKTTDDITWSTNNPSVATVDYDPEAQDGDQTKAVITATDGIGKATITAKSTSGKTAKFSVVVNATLISIDNVSISGDCAWSGKTEELIIDRTPIQNRDKFKITSDKKLVKAKSTANISTITPANDLKLSGSEEGIEATLTVAPSDKNSEVKPKEAKITVMQSDVEIKKVTDVSDNRENAKDMHKQTIRTNPGETYAYELELNAKRPADEAGKDAVSWISSNVKVATIDNDGHLTVVGQGTTKITVSSIYKNNKGKYVQSKKTFTVKSTPECDGIELKNNTAAYDLSKKKSVTINVKQQLPKKANDEIEWYVNGVKQPVSKNATDKKLTILPSNAAFSGVQENTTVEVMAVSKMDSSVYAVATIYVVKPAAKKVAFSDKYKKGVTLSVGATKTDIEAPTVTGSQNDPIVSYTVDKKGVGVVKAEMTESGELKLLKLIGVGEGKATVTALTASGKKGTLKVIVN